MISNLSEIKHILNNNKSNLAFIVGNGINRIAYPKNQDVSWDALLFDIWHQVSNRRLTNISNGISLTEFYDIIEFEAGSINKERQKVVELLYKWGPVEYHN